MRDLRMMPLPRTVHMSYASMQAAAQLKNSRRRIIIIIISIIISTI